MGKDFQPAKRIKGQQLGQYLNSDIVLLGQVQKISSTGKGVEMLTTDKVTVNVSLPEQFDGNCEGYIEVNGTALSKSTVSAHSYMHFPPDMCNQFDDEKYNAFLVVMHVLGEKKWLLSEEDAPY